MTPNTSASITPEEFHTSVLRTKFRPPNLPPYAIPRTRLSRQLSSQPFRLALVTAPAGFGKSVCVRSWLAERDEPYGWLSLDSRDNDYRRFLTYLTFACRMVDDSVGGPTLQYLESSNISDPETLLTPLINDLEQLEKECFLVLDDYHEIDTPEIHTALKLLLTHLPEHVHVVLVTRVDPAFPISQFRVSGELVEIREESLRFTHEEVVEFSRKQGIPEISEESIRLLSERTEGWVAGLQLAMVSLKQEADPERFLRNFSGQTGFILDYLMEEVLSRQSEDLQSFLVQTSILQRLHPDLCRAVTGMEHAGRLLQEVAQRNLFLMPLDMQQSWYRYHHLFGELLQMRLQQRFPEMTDELHLRASRWYAKRGAFEQAIDHALQTSTRDEALELLDKQAGMTLLAQSKVRTYRRLVDQLPESRIQEYPMILVGRAWADMLSMRTTDLEQDITRVQKALNSPGCAYSSERRSRVKAFLQALEAYNLRVSGQLKQAIDLSRESVESVPEELPLVRALLRYNMARAYMQMGYIREPMELLQAVQDIMHIEQSPYLRVGAAGHIGFLEIQDRGPVAAQERLEHALQGVRTQEMDQLPVVSYLHYPLGYAKYLANDIDGAQEHLTHAVELSEKGLDPFILYRALIVLGWCYIVRGDNSEAQRLQSRAERVYRESAVPIFESDPSTDRLKFELLAGNMDVVVEGVRAAGNPRDGEFSVIVETRAFIALQAAIHQRDQERVRALIGWMGVVLRERGRQGALLRLRILETLHLYDTDQREGAYALLDEVLPRMAGRKEIRPVLNYGEPFRTLLNAYLSEHEVPSDIRSVVRILIQELEATRGIRLIPGFEQSLVDPLTEREQEVLGYLARGYTNREIANRLYVSVNTVKTHLKNLYGKLGVNSREEAVEWGEGGP